MLERYKKYQEDLAAQLAKQFPVYTPSAEEKAKEKAALAKIKNQQPTSADRSILFETPDLAYLERLADEEAAEDEKRMATSIKALSQNPQLGITAATQPVAANTGAIANPAAAVQPKLD